MEESNNRPKPIKIPDFSKKAFNVPEEKVVKSSTNVKIQKNNSVDYLIQAAVFLFLSILILIAVYFVYNYAQDFLLSGQEAKEQKLVFENELVRADRSRVVSLEAGATKENVRSVVAQALQNEHVNKGEISLVMPSYLRDTVINGERKLVSELQRGDDFFFTFAPRSTLGLRTISAEKYAIGVAGVGDVNDGGNKNFFTFSVSSAPDATREMLAYETQIYNDMKQLLKLRDLEGAFYFKDLSYNNHTLRVGYDDKGVVVAYGFGAPSWCFLLT
jgi:Na+-transporting methylmalonyl-CoA/oxaloacetate decarboxylase gamma subunit